MAKASTGCKGRRTLIKYLLLGCLIGAGALASACRKDPRKEAERLIERGRYREAITKLEPIIQAEEKGDLLYLLGTAYASLKDFYQADSYYQRALSVDPTLTAKVLTRYLALGDKLSNSKEEALAVSSWERVLSLDPDYELGERFYHLGNHHFVNQDYRRASQLYPRALNSSPLSPLARDGKYRLVLSLERIGELEEALRWCQERRGEGSQDLLYEEGKIAYSLAEKSLQGGDERRALQLLRRTIDLGQPRILLDDAHFLAGEIHLHREEYEEALRSYKKVLRLNPYQKGGVVQRARERIKQISAGKGVGR